jgi:ornithine decarboxylase
VPAPIVAQYLRENRVVPEKYDLNSLLFLLTLGVESSKAGTLVSALVAFKRLHDDNAPLADVMPEFVTRRPARYRGLRLRDLCAEMHGFFRNANVSALQKAQFSPKHLPEMVMTPREASRHLVRNNVDYLPIDEIEGRNRDDALRHLSAGHRDDRGRRKTLREGAADDRISQNL